jgi:hypothetical protein
VEIESTVTSLASLVEQLGQCLAYADAQQDHVLAALISTAHESALAKLAQLVGGR